MRMIKRAYNKVRKAVKKRYVAKSGGRKSTGGMRVGKMAKDIMYLKSVLNPEKKRTETSLTNSLLGQVNANLDGFHLSDITPIPPVGTGYSDRNGASIKLHSSMWHFQFKQQSAATCKIRGIIEIWEVKGDPYPAASFEFTTERFIANPFTTVRDMNCQQDPDNYMKARCIARRNFSVQTDSLGNEALTTDVKIPILYNKGQGKHIRFEKNSPTVLANGQMYLVIRVDRGNYNTTTPSTLTVPDLAPNTGLTFGYNCTNYYYDN